MSHRTPKPAVPAPIAKGRPFGVKNKVPARTDNFDGDKYVTANTVAVTLRMSRDPVKLAARLKKSFGVVPVSSYLYAGRAISLYSKADLERLIELRTKEINDERAAVLAAREARTKSVPAPVPAPAVAPAAKAESLKADQDENDTLGVARLKLQIARVQRDVDAVRAIVTSTESLVRDLLDSMTAPSGQSPAPEAG